MGAGTLASDSRCMSQSRFKELFTGWRGQLALYLSAYGVYSLARWVALGDPSLANANAHRVIDLERELHLQVERSVQRTLDIGAPIWLLNHGYLAAQPWSCQAP
jgi:hypothetical protein